MEPTKLQVHVDIDCESGDAFREVVNWWLDALVALGSVDGVMSRLGPARLGGDWGYDPETGPIQSDEYSPGARQDFDANLAQGFGDGHFNIYGLHQVGGPVRALEVQCWCLSGDEPKVQLLAEVKLNDSAIPAEVDAVERELRDALDRFVQQARPWYAGISDDFNRDSVPSDLAQAVNNAVARTESERVLRGYSWVTYCPAHLADSLGGAEALEASGVFWNVTSMPGGVLLQATEHLREYAGEVVRRVQGVLSPVLRDKQATKPTWPGKRLRQRHLRVAWDDGTSGPFGPPPTREEWAGSSRKRRGSDTSDAPSLSLIQGAGSHQHWWLNDTSLKQELVHVPGLACPMPAHPQLRPSPNAACQCVSTPRTRSRLSACQSSVCGCHGHSVLRSSAH